MLNMFIGTPGSGKSYHCAREIVRLLRSGKNVISNFEIDTSSIKPYFGKKLGHFIYVNMWDISVVGLKGFSKNFHRRVNGRVLEGQTLVIFDEVQRRFDSRGWAESGRKEWNDFLCEHRKYGYDILFITPDERTVDRRMRALVEYSDMHRKLGNFKLFGKLLSFFVGGELFIVIRRWYGLNEKIGSKLLRGSKRYYKLYNTSLTFDKDK